MVPDQRDVQTAASQEYGAHVPHTVRANFEASERLITIQQTRIIIIIILS